MTGKPKDPNKAYAKQHGGSRPAIRPDDGRYRRKKKPGEKFVTRLISLPADLDDRLGQEENASGLIQQLLTDYFSRQAPAEE